MTSTIGHKDDTDDEADADNDADADADKDDDADSDDDGDNNDNAYADKDDDNDDDDNECHLRLGETKSTAEPPAESANTWKEPRDSKCEIVKVRKCQQS